MAVSRISSLLKEVPQVLPKQEANRMIRPLLTEVYCYITEHQLVKLECSSDRIHCLVAQKSWALFYFSEYEFKFFKVQFRELPGGQWLGLWAFTAKGAGLIPGQGTKIPQAVWCDQKKNMI